MRVSEELALLFYFPHYYQSCFTLANIIQFWMTWIIALQKYSLGTLSPRPSRPSELHFCVWLNTLLLFWFLVMHKMLAYWPDFITGVLKGICSAQMSWMSHYMWCCIFVYDCYFCHLGHQRALLGSSIGFTRAENFGISLSPGVVYQKWFSEELNFFDSCFKLVEVWGTWYQINIFFHKGNIPWKVLSSGPRRTS